MTESAVAVALAVILIVLYAATGSRSKARIEIEPNAIRVIPEGLAKLWSLRASVRVDTARITEVHESFDQLPGNAKKRVGMVRGDGVKAFLIVGVARPVVVIECPGDKFDRVVFSAEDPDSIVRDITFALPSHLP